MGGYLCFSGQGVGHREIALEFFIRYHTSDDEGSDESSFSGQRRTLQG
jgi:hypothetical protein